MEKMDEIKASFRANLVRLAHLDLITTFKFNLTLGQTKRTN